jgi:4'-phosphopantetheinyl transferase EntD
MPTTDELDTPHGRCVVLELHETDDLSTVLLPDEHALAEQLGPVRRRELAAGRGAMRSALGIQTPILIDDRGAPVLPPGWVGSISHKGTRAAALVAPADNAFIGIDLEHAAPPRMPIERRILTERERAAIAPGSREVTLHFAIKEAVYKAIDPIVRRYVGFTEVELALHVDGRCDVGIVDAASLPVVVEAWWQERDGFWLATARARKA